MDVFVEVLKNDGLWALIGAVLGALVMFRTSKANLKLEKENVDKQIKAEFELMKETIKSDNDKLLIQFQNEISENNKNRIAEHQTDRRVEWMYMVRDEISNYIAICMSIKGSELGCEDKIEKSERICLNKSIAKLKLLFNFIGEEDKEIIMYMDTITKNLSSGTSAYFNDQNDINFTYQIEEFIRLTQIYLKLEWERIKLESEGVSKSDINVEIKKLKDSYNDLRLEAKK